MHNNTLSRMRLQRHLKSLHDEINRQRQLASDMEVILKKAEQTLRDVFIALDMQVSDNTFGVWVENDSYLPVSEWGEVISYAVITDTTWLTLKFDVTKALADNQCTIAWKVLPRYQLRLIVRREGDSSFPKHPTRICNLPDLSYYDNGVPYFEDWEDVWDLLLQ